MEIPDRLDNLLRKGGDTLYGAARKSVGDFETWLGDRKLVFFDEYTDHGLSHVERVLRGADWLLPEDAFESLGPKDAAVLILAVLLHDSAMHLSRDGFLRIIDREAGWPPEGEELLNDMRDPPWPDLWERFLAEARRWDEQKRVALFGKPRAIRRPPEGDAPWADDDRFLIGEFLRRHHPRLAHEIAICGVPGPSEDRLELSDLEPWLADLAGLVARSHGLELRWVVERLPREDRPDKRGVHAPLLMSLLRVADYLEVDATRAPEVLLKIRRLRSPISSQEWEKHRAVPYMKIDPYDREALQIDVEPKELTSATFVGLQKLFAGLQRELDASWAVLGEVYSRIDPRVALRIRRIRSTLDDLDKLSKRVAFVPVRARFDSAGGDLLKLMVGPLYDHEPAYGVRELIQNAVDACREVEDLVERRPELEGERAKLEADVVITVEEEEEGQGLITVDDRGIGMSPDVIVNYFLKAGASLRDSEAWHRRHADAEGRPRVTRSGRFGLGVLATFLLGDEVEVTTRQAGEPPERGVEFTARLDSPHVELRWKERPVGTTIRVRVTNRPEVFDALANVESWDWYRLQQPSLLRRMQLQREREELLSAIPAGQEITLEHGEIVPLGGSPPPAPWRSLTSTHFVEILWSLQRETGWADVVNGLLLKRPDVVSTKWRVLWPHLSAGTDLFRDRPRDFFLFRPRLAVMEGASLLTVDLRRTEIIGPLPFEDDLANALCRDVLASLLVRAAESPLDVLRQIARATPLRDRGSFTSLASLWHPAISTDRDEHGTKRPGGYRTPSWLFVTREGLTLEDPALETEEPRRGVAFVVTSDSPYGDDAWTSSSRVSEPADALLAAALERLPAGFPLGTQSTLGSRVELEDHRRSGGYTSAAMVVPTARWGTEEGAGGRQGLEHTHIDNGWTVAWTGDDPTGSLDLTRLASQPAGEGDLPLVLFLLRFPLPEERERDPRNPLSRLWRELLYHGEIRYERALRKQVLARAFDELEEEINLWQRLASADVGGDSLAAARYWIDTREVSVW